MNFEIDTWDHNTSEHTRLQEVQKRRALKTFIFLVTGTLIPFGVLNFYFGNYPLAYFEIGVATTTILMLKNISNIHMLQPLSYFFIFLSGAMLLSVIFYFSTTPSALGWVSIYPMITLFLLGRQKGIIAHLVFSTAVIILLLLDVHPYGYHTTTRMVFNITGILIATGVMAYLYEGSKNRAVDLVYRHSFFDELTSAGNRKLFTRTLEKERAIAQRTNRNLSLIMMDLDHFKEINDRYGHIVGDKVLQEFAHMVMDLLRKSDMFFRWGGEEFIVLLSDTTGEQAKYLAEVIRKHIIHHPIEPVGTLSASFSVTQIQPAQSDEETLRRLDTALYLAKTNGRNRVEMA